ncbi:MAG: caspase family protein, partial [Armatimonadetes bacterium]|nr:caspase family protein [Armatimonadota bacterium]
MKGRNTQTRSRNVLRIGFAALLLSTSLAVSQTAPASKSDRVRLVPISSNQLVFDLQESPDGTRLISHDRQYAPRLWDTRTMSLLKVMGGNTETVVGVEFSKSGKEIITVSGDRMTIWNAKTANILATVPAPGPTEGYKDAQFMYGNISQDGTQAVGVTIDNMTVVYDLANKTTKSFKSGTLAEGGGTGIYAEFSPDGKMIFTGTALGIGKVWTTKGDLLATLPNFKNTIFGGHFSRDSKALVVTAYGKAEDTGHSIGSMHVFETGSWKELFSKPAAIGSRFRTADVSSRFVLPDESAVTVLKNDGKIEILNRQTGAPIRTLLGNTDAVREVRVSGDGLKIATYSDANELFIWDIATGKVLPFQNEHYGPTAATFSTDNKSFWIGYEDGAIRKYDVATGKIILSRTRTTIDVRESILLGDGAHIWSAGAMYGGFSSRRTNQVWNSDSPTNPLNLVEVKETPQFSPDGRYMAAETTEGARFIDTLKNTAWTFKDDTVSNFCFSPDSKHVLIAFVKGSFGYYECDGFKLEKVWELKVDEASRMAQFYPGGNLVLTNDHDVNGDKFHWLGWNPLTGAVVADFGKYDTFGTNVGISQDGKLAAFQVGYKINLHDAQTGKLLRKLCDTKDDQTQSHLIFSPDGKTLSAQNGVQTSSFNVETGKQIFTTDSYNHDYEQVSMVSPTKPWVVTIRGNVARVIDYDSGKEIAKITKPSEVTMSYFTQDGKRLITLDSTDGMSIHFADFKSGGELPTFDKIGAFIQVLDPESADQDGYSWLCMDSHGRYDCERPNDVVGANFVFEWEGGLESVAVSQLKQQFYEPGLLMKLLGLNAEPMRDVPDLEGLRLYPTLKVTRNDKNPMQFEVSAKERDAGGVGQTRVTLNGKEIVRKEGSGYFKFSLEDYKSYLLPESMLTNGQGNILEVTVTNEALNLTSPPTIMDIGVPEGLKLPEIKMYALFAGVGDYVGENGDLASPPSDAEALGTAVKDVSNRLLPGRVEVTTLTTNSKDPFRRPTRANIMAWLADTGKKATSSDIVVVFFAGHGSSQIGEKRGYFFLTPEADPGDLNEASIATSTITGDDLKNALTAIAASKQVVILDTCHSGAAADSLFKSRSVPSDYQRAYEAIRESTGTWMLAGAAADQLSYESTNVEHGMLTYALLEALDRVTGDGLRKSESGQLFVDVKTWLQYAAERVDSLKTDVGLRGVQRPELKASTTNKSFDIGVTSVENKGKIGLKPPKPVVILGAFSFDEEDPIKLENALHDEMMTSIKVKTWFDI